MHLVMKCTTIVLFLLRTERTSNLIGCDCDVVLFDDVEAGSIPPLLDWKRLCDRYGYDQIAGTFRPEQK